MCACREGGRECLLDTIVEEEAWSRGMGMTGGPQGENEGA